jgi:hypothetical protein
MLYLLGLSCGAVSLALEALGVYLCRSRVCDIVQDAAEQVPEFKREAVFEGLWTPAIGGDITAYRLRLLFLDCDSRPPSQANGARDERHPPAPAASARRRAGPERQRTRRGPA